VKLEILTDGSVKRRSLWVDKIKRLSGHFGNDTQLMTKELSSEIKDQGIVALLDHLRLCGAIPEVYGHDSSEEKLYSKYTDSLLDAAFRFVGLNSIVLSERADAADVEVVVKDFSFVADAKAFRLSRTAKNQKDFKVQAMDGWKRGKPFAMVVCPIYQLPAKSSQIYQQASARNVCIFTYSHLALLIEFSKLEGNKKAQDLLHEIFKVIQAFNPTKNATSYWQPLNRVMLDFSKQIPELWKNEKLVAIESIQLAKAEALTHLALERSRIMSMSKEDAIQELILEHNIDSRIAVIGRVSDNGIMDIT
jgi:type II restriction enzyme